MCTQKSVCNLLIPAKTIEPIPGSFQWPGSAVFTSPRIADRLPLRQLTDDLGRFADFAISVEFRAGGPATLRVSRDPGVSNPEGYRLDVRPDGIEIAAATDAGVYYGIQTLRELIWAEPDAAGLGCVQIEDEPDFARRGVYFDCARGKVPKIKTLKALIERLASWKINELQLYIKNGFTWQNHPKIGKGFSPYTPEDLLTLQEHCKLHHIRFVPSLATMSHNELTLQLPEYQHLAELPGALGWEGGTMLCPTDPGSIRLVEELYAEFLPLFEADDMNVCCDEPWELGKGRSAEAVRKRGEGRVYLDFLLQVHDICQRHGKRMNAWGDIVMAHSELIPELPRDVVMLNWDYEADGKRIPRTHEFTDVGIPVVACPGTSSWQRHGTDMPNAIGNVANFAKTAREHGALGMLNTDWGDYGHRQPLGVSLHGFAHGAAHSWHGAAVDDGTFTATFAAQVFGERGGKLAESIRVLGRTAAGMSTGNSCVLYHALVEPLRTPHTAFIDTFKTVSEIIHYPEYYPNAIENADTLGLRGVVTDLSGLEFAAPEESVLPEFEQTALAEYRLAARMDHVAARRALLALAVRSGETVSAKQMKEWQDDMCFLIHDFEQNWRDRNRPGLLRDNLTLMRLSMKDSW
jgi:hexosaminidase